MSSGNIESRKRIQTYCRLRYHFQFVVILLIQWLNAFRVTCDRAMIAETSLKHC